MKVLRAKKHAKMRRSMAESGDSERRSSGSESEAAEVEDNDLVIT